MGCLIAVGTRDPDKPASPSGSLGLALDDPSKAVNTSIDYVGYNPNEDSEGPNLLSLSNELLVKIMLSKRVRSNEDFATL